MALMDIFKPRVMRLSFVDISPEMKMIRARGQNRGNKVAVYDVPLSSSSYMYIPYIVNSGRRNFELLVDYNDSDDLDEALVEDETKPIGVSKKRTALRARLEFTDVYPTEMIDSSNQNAALGQVGRPHMVMTSPEPMQDTATYQKNVESESTDQINKQAQANLDGFWTGTGYTAMRGDGAAITLANGSIGIAGERIVMPGQEKKPSWIYNTNLNFVKHYMIAIADVVTFLPMQDMPDIIEIAKTANMVATIIQPTKDVTDIIRS